GAREALDQLECIGIRVAICSSIPEVRGLDDKRIPFPVTTGVTHIEAKPLIRVRPGLQRDHPRFVNHFVANPDPPWSLDNLVRIAIDRGKHRARKTAGNAAIVKAEVLDAVEGPVREAAAGSTWACRGSRRRTLLRLSGQWRDFSIGGIDNHPRAIALRDFAAVAEFGIPTDAARWIAGEKRGALVGQALPFLKDARQLRTPNVIDASALESGRTLHWCPLLVFVGEAALDVRVAPRRPA